MNDRRYPKLPIPGVGGIVVGPEGVLLIIRDKEPGKGLLTIPGGGVEVGETQEQAIVREVKEETGVDCEVIQFVDSADLIMPDEDGAIEYHFILNHYLCRAISFQLKGESVEVQPRWVRPSELKERDLPPRILELLLSVLDEIEDLVTK